jgi:hypothetical protein
MARRKSDPNHAKPGAEERAEERADERIDQREAQRFTLILRAGKLVTGQGEFLCVLRDVSRGGLKVRLFHPLALDGPCRIELSGGGQYRLEPAWQHGEEAGLRFSDAPIDIEQLLEEAGPFPKRAIRLSLRGGWPVTLHGATDPLPAQICDISQHGCAVLCTQRLSIGQLVEIEDAAIGAIEGRVRWRRGDRYGLVFQQSFRLDSLARLTYRLQSAQKMAAPPIEALRVNH